MYHHQSLGSPPKTTLLQAIKRNPNLYSTLPGLKYELISKNLPPSEATEKEHMIQIIQGIISTCNVENKLGFLLIDCSKVVCGVLPSDWWWYIASSACKLVSYKLPAYSSFD